MAIDPWGENECRLGLIGPMTHSQTVTPTDVDTTSNVPVGTRGVLVDVAGAVEVKFKSGAVDTVQLTAGVWHPMRITHVYDGDTTATGIHAGL